MRSNITIYRNGSRPSIVVTSSCMYNYDLMSTEYVELVFNAMSNFTPLKYGDYIIYEGKHYYIISADDYSVVNSGGIQYKQKFYAEWERWRNVVLFYDRQSGIEAGWGMTNSASAFMSIVVSNINAAGFGQYAFSVDDKLTEYKYINFEGSVDIVSALGKIAETYECEWWVEEGTIYLGTCLRNVDAVELAQDGNVKTLQTQASQSGNKTTRLYAFGSDQNMTTRYRKSLEFVAGDVAWLEEIRSNLPAGYTGAIADINRPVTAEMFPVNDITYTRKTFSFVAEDSNLNTEYSGGECIAYLIKPAFYNAGNSYGGHWIQFTGGTVTATLTGVGTLNVVSMELEVRGRNQETKMTIPLSVSGRTGTFPTDRKDLYIDKNEAITFAVKVVYTLHRTSRNEASYSDVTIKTNNTYFSVYCGNPQTAVTLKVGGNTYNAILNPFCYNTLESLSNCIVYDGLPVSAGTRYTLSNIYTTKVPASYLGDKNSSVIEGIAQNNLMLPNEPCYKDGNGEIYRESELASTEGYTQVYDGGGYIEVETNDAIVEGVNIFEDIYPRQIVTISEIKSVKRSQWNEEKQVNDEWQEYELKATGLERFNKNWILPNETLKIHMQDGLLAGMIFDCSLDEYYNETTQLYDTWFRIERNEDDYGTPVPNATLKPEVGKKFILSGFDIGFVDEGLVAAAEKELLKEALAYMEELHSEAATYTCNLNIIDAIQEDLYAVKIGTPVALTTHRGVINTRVRGIKRAIDDRQLVLTLGKTAAYSRFSKLENTIDGLTYETKMFSSVVAQYSQAVNVIKLNAALDSLREEIKEQYLDKTKEDIAREMTRFNKGVVFGEAGSAQDFVQGGSGCKIYHDGTSWCMQVEKLNVTKKLEAKSVTIEEVQHVGGQLLLTAASCKVDYVKKFGSTSSKKYNVYFLKKDENGNAVKNEWKTGDYAYCQRMNINDGTSENYTNTYYWIYVDAVGETTTHHYIRLDMSKADNGGVIAVESDYNSFPNPGDNIVQLGYKKQPSDTDEYASARSGAVFISGGTAGQYISIFSDIQPFTLPTPKIHLSPTSVKITADDIKLSSAGVLELGSKQLLCKNTEGTKTAWLDELGNFVTTGIQAQQAQTIDTAAKLLERFVPICRKTGDITICEFVCPGSANFDSENWKVGKNGQLYYNESAVVDGVTCTAISPISTEEDYAYEYGNRSAKIYLAMDMRCANGFINLGYLPARYESQDMTDVYGIILPYFNVLGYDKDKGLLTSYCRTPSRVSGEGMDFITLTEIKSLVGRRMTLVNTHESAIVGIKLNEDNDGQNEVTLLPGQSVSLEFVNGVYDTNVDCTYYSAAGVVTHFTMDTEYYGWELVSKQDATKENDLDNGNFGTDIHI